MRKWTFITVGALVGTLFACQSEPEKKDKQVKPETESVLPAFNDEKIDKKTEKRKKPSNFDEYVEDYEFRKNELIEKLKTATPQFAHYLYLDFRKENEEMTGHLYDLEMNMLEDWAGLYDEDGELSFKKYGGKIRKAEAAGMEFWGVGEGMTEVRVEPREYAKIFRGKVSPDLEKFILLNQKDDEVLMVNDAGLSISFKEMADVILRWEKFIQTYPKSKMKPEAKQLYETYQIWYLFGLDNTPTRDYELGKLYDESKTEMERFLIRYPESPTSKLVKMVLESEESTEDLLNQVSEAQNALLRKM